MYSPDKPVVAPDNRTGHVGDFGQGPVLCAPDGLVCAPDTITGWATRTQPVSQ